MQLSRRRDALLIGAALVLGCAMSSPRGASSDADARPCTVSSLQLARASERTLYDVMERICPSMTRLQQNGREVRAFIVLAGAPVTPLGGATALRLFRPADIARVRFFPRASDEQPAVALVLVELREPRPPAQSRETGQRSPQPVRRKVSLTLRIFHWPPRRTM